MELFWGFQRFQLLFSALFRIFGCCLGNLCGFSYFFLLFSGFLSWVWLDLGCCLGNLCGFSYFFLLFSGFLGWILGAVLGFSAVSATFSRIFADFLDGFWVLFGEFLRFQLHKARLLCYQPMAIVHYDNLKIQHFLNKKVKKVNVSYSLIIEYPTPRVAFIWAAEPTDASFLRK